MPIGPLPLARPAGREQLSLSGVARYQSSAGPRRRGFSVLFNSLDYGVFFAVVFVGSWAAARWLRGWARVVLLLAASYWFYGHWNWRYLPLLFGTSTVDFWLGRMIGASAEPARRKRLLVLALVCNLGLLAVFKYWNFGVENVRLAWSTLSGHALGAPSQALALLLPPVGISFFTFVALGYVIDVYRRRIEPCPSYLRFTLFVSLFPHLVAGPIVRARDLLPQLEAPPALSREVGGEALFLVAIGLLKKMVIADQLAMQLCDRVFDAPHAFSALEVLGGVYGYALQIYCDFSGYSDIAIGSALLLGVRFPVNFDAPYKSSSPAEFWRRWHISLSSWLRDYLFAPLGGAMGSAGKTVRNLLITMLLGGLWHGAAWTFVLWGLLHGLGLVGSHAVQRLRAGRRERRRAARLAAAAGDAAALAVGAVREGPPGRPRPKRARRRFARGLATVVGWFFTFHFVCLGWILFRAPSLRDAVTLVRRLGTLGTEHPNLPPFVLGLLAVGFATHLAPARLYRSARERFIALPAPAQGLVLFLVALVLHEAASTASVPFVYFQF